MYENSTGKCLNKDASHCNGLSEMISKKPASTLVR